MNSESDSRRRPAPVGWMVAGIIVGLLIGFLIGRQGRKAPTFEEVLAIGDRPNLGNERLHRMLQFAERCGPGEVEEALDRIFARNRSHRSHELMRILYSRWAELDLGAAVAHAHRLEGDEQQRALGAVISLWAAEDPMAAWEWIRKEGAKIRGMPGNSVLLEIARTDPEKALAMFDTSTTIRREGISDDPSFLYAAWAIRDPAAAAAHLLGLESAAHRRAAAPGIANIWSETDPDAAWEWTKKLPRDEERAAAEKMLFTMLAVRDLEKAEAMVGGLSEGDEKKRAAESTLNGLIIAQPETAYEFAKKHLSATGSGSMFSFIFNGWAAKDPDRAFAVAKAELKPGNTRSETFRHIILETSQRDVDRAVEMLGELGLDSNYPYAAGFVGRALAKRDVEEAKTWVESLPPGEMKRQALSEVVSEWIEETPEAAIAYARAADAADPRGGLLRTAYSKWGYRDPEKAVRWGIGNLETGDQRSMVPSAVGEWAEEDPEAASAWVEKLSGDAGDLKKLCFRQLASTWAHLDPSGGEVWLESLAAGPEKDQAIEGFSGRLSNSDPAAALTWASKIGDENQRNRAVEFPARRWLDSQPEKARAWIRSSDLPEELKQKLLGKEA